MTPSSSKRKRGKERQVGKQQQRPQDDDGSRPAQHLFAEQDGLILGVLVFLDVVTLVKKKQVNKKWQVLCTMAIDNKCTNPKDFGTNRELRNTVGKYCGNKPSDIEEISCTYGYPINKWRVHKLEDFSRVFDDMIDFNEDINAWDVSNAKNFAFLFAGARKFNKPLASWDTSNVTDMEHTFYLAHSFNQSLDTWDTSKVTSMFYMFKDARSFNQSLDNWDFSSLQISEHMLRGALDFAQELPEALDADTVFRWDFTP